MANLSYASIYDFTLQTNKGELKLSDYKSKNVVITNIATRCGYTPQLEKINELYVANKEKLLIIGVPSNEFGGQSPEDDKGIVEFCKINYGVKFPIAKKTNVKGDQASKLFQYLIKKSDNKAISWNFEKFLILPNESSIKHFRSGDLKILN